jgi:hypothetical protein
MKITFFTIVLNGAPWIYNHLPMMQRLTNIDWRWIVIEGAAKPVKDTAWCKPIKPMLSDDGTHEYLQSISNHPRVEFRCSKEWEGKLNMCNVAIDTFINEPCLLIQLDADELYEAWQIVFAMEMFKANPDYNTAQLFCRYYVGNNIVITSKDNYGNRASEWKRMWRFEPGMRWKSHEPPVWENFEEKIISREQMAGRGIVFEHHAYATEAQVKFKEVYYGYERAFWNWNKLQVNTKWPVKELRDFLPWVDEGATADRLYK